MFVTYGKNASAIKWPSLSGTTGKILCLRRKKSLVRLTPGPWCKIRFSRSHILFATLLFNVNPYPYLSFFRFSCKSCGKSFGRNEHLKGHILRIHLQITGLKCSKCPEEFAEKYDLERHVKKFHRKRVKLIRRKLDEAENTDLITSAESTRWNFCDCSFFALQRPYF